MLNYTEPRLSPSQQAVLHAIEKNPIRYLPKWAVIEDETHSALLHILGCRWEWSWTILQEAHTADYRRRIWEINQIPGYKIISFYAPWMTLGDSDAFRSKTITRHGYILIPPSKQENHDQQKD